jgi:hypothetical protein
MVTGANGSARRQTDEATRMSCCGGLENGSHGAAGVRWLAGQTVRLQTGHGDLPQPSVATARGAATLLRSRDVGGRCVGGQCTWSKAG